MLAAGVAGYGASYFVRGIVGGARWSTRATASLLLADGGVRAAGRARLFVWVSPSLAAAALAAAAIGGARRAAAHAAVRRVRVRHGGAARRSARAGAPALCRRAAVLAVGDQILLSGGPVLVMLHGASDAAKTAGVVFAATMLVRAPAYLFQGVAAALLPNLTTMLVQRDERRFRAAVSRTVVLVGRPSRRSRCRRRARAGPVGDGACSTASGFSAAGTELAVCWRPAPAATSWPRR